MKIMITSAIVATVSGVAAAQTATVTFTPSSTSIDTSSANAADRTITVDVAVSGDQGLTTFDVVLDNLGDTGAFSIQNIALVNPLLFTALPGLSEVTLSDPSVGGLQVRGFGTAGLFSGDDISGTQFTFDLVADQDAAGFVELTAIESGFSAIASFGLFADTYPNLIINNSTITFIPAPGAGALLGMSGLVAARRRRG